MNLQRFASQQVQTGGGPAARHPEPEPLTTTERRRRAHEQPALARHLGLGDGGEREPFLSW